MTAGITNTTAGCLDDRECVTKILTIIHVFVAPLLSLLGVLGNAWNIHFLKSKGLKNNIKCVLVSLAVVDLLFSLTQPFIHLNWVSNMLNLEPLYTVTLYFQLVVNPLNRFCLLSNVFHVILISVVRLVAIGFPFHLTRVFTTRRIQISLAAIHILPTTLIMSLYTLDIIYIITLNNAKINKIIAAYINSKTFLKIEKMFANIVIPQLFFTFPLMIILSCTIATTYKMCKQRYTFADKSGSNTINEAKVFWTLYAICISKLLLCLPGSMVYSLYGLHSDWSALKINLLEAVVSIFNAVNASSNVVIYLFNNKCSR